MQYPDTGPPGSSGSLIRSLLSGSIAEISATWGQGAREALLGASTTVFARVRLKKESVAPVWAQLRIADARSDNARNLALGLVSLSLHGVRSVKP